MERLFASGKEKGENKFTAAIGAIVNFLVEFTNQAIEQFSGKRK